MKQAIKYTVYVAAGVGMFEILRRTGLLAKAGEWLQELVPDDVKNRAKKMGEQVHHQVEGAASQLRDKAGHFMGKAHEAVEQGATIAGRVSDNLKNGVSEMTEDSDGASIPHKVGRGIIHEH